MQEYQMQKKTCGLVAKRQLYMIQKKLQAEIGGYYTNTAYYYSDTSFDLFTFHCCYDLLAWYCSLIVLFSTWSRMDRVASFHGCTGNTRTDSTLCVCFPCSTRRGL